MYKAIRKNPSAAQAADTILTALRGIPVSALSDNMHRNIGFDIARRIRHHVALRKADHEFPATLVAGQFDTPRPVCCIFPRRETALAT
ncbi:hypothetical protein B0G75_112128 [Paraburkholderia sp. BL18I3N2]|uniref:hypothetical protein n=1 Tax=Paraburkholderia sp. BL18I3N2 TaxID=1938799 RepID=UPI000D472336|nr:hypothetical protein [Paraburkholderia sp. BL18I3N2]PRX28185.1 hypothetical protein B0G75_112128 [Paraburkholderia sp. BL18I3N2]